MSLRRFWCFGEACGAPAAGATARNNSINQADTTDLVLTVLPALGTPDSLTILANNDSTVTLSWPPVDGASNYYVEAATQADFFDLTIIATVTDTFYIDSTDTAQKFYVIVANP